MSLQVETKTIEGLQVRTQQLPALRSFRLFNKLGKILAPVLTRVADLKISEDMEIGELAPALGELFAHIDPGESDTLAKEILAMTSVVYENKNFELANEGAIDTIFTGRFKAFLMTMAFALQVNYQDFFADALGSVVPSASGSTPKNPEESPSS